MERENFVNPELTQQGQNAYSRSEGNIMPEPGSGDTPPKPTPRGEFSDEQKLAALQNILQNSDIDVGAKKAVVQQIAELFSGKPANFSASGSGGERAAGIRRPGSEPSPEIPALGYRMFTDPELTRIATTLRMLGKNIIKDKNLIDELEARARERMTVNPDAAADATELINYLGNVRSALEAIQGRTSAEARHTFQLSLTTKDLDAIEEDAMEWLDGQFDRLYDIAKEGSELDSPQVGAIQSQVEAASRFLSTTKKGEANPETIGEFNAKFLNRLNLLFARSTIQQRNMEGIQGISKRVQVHGLMNTLTFENGLVNRMHNRINEMYDDIRITLDQHHITPDVHSQIQTKVINEYVKLITESNDEQLLSEIGVTGNMSQARKDKVVQSTIRRAVRTAYDHFVASQREAVVVARGDALPLGGNLEGILADPSGLFMMFNYEQLLVAKFGLLNHEQEKFFTAIKRRYAESVLTGKEIDINNWVRERAKIDPSILYEEDHKTHVQKRRSDSEVREAALTDYGRTLIRDLLLVNDFYSSPWKIDQFTKQLNDNFKYQFAKRAGKTMSELTEEEAGEAEEKAGNFALFMRIRAIHGSTTTPTEQKSDAKKEIWAKIAKYKPEDIIKMFREHEGREKNERGELYRVNEAFKEAGLRLAPDEAQRGLTYYDKFKEKYAGVLRLIREQGYAGDIPEQIDFSEIMSNPRYVEILNKTLGDGEASKIATLFIKLKEFAGNKNTIDKLMTDIRFDYANIRAQSIDDALLDRMETTDEKVGLTTTLSRKLSAESGGDAYVRTFGDAVNANEAHTQFLNFLMQESAEEKLKAARAAAAATKRYASPTAGANVFRYTYGSYILMGAVTDESKLGTIYEVFDIRGLPGRKPISDLQRIFGPQAPAFNNDQMLHFLDEHRADLVGSGHDAEKLWLEMRRLARVRGKDRAKFMTYRALIFMLAYLIFESVYSTAKTIDEGLETEELK